MSKQKESRKDDDRRRFMKRVAGVAAGVAAVGVGVTAAKSQPGPRRESTFKFFKPGGPRGRVGLKINRLDGKGNDILQGRDRAFAEVTAAAMDSLDMDRALQEHGEGLSSQDMQMLQRLDVRDLADLRAILSKLGSAEGESAPEQGRTGFILF